MNALQNSFCWCLEPNIEQDSFYIFINTTGRFKFASEIGYFFCSISIGSKHLNHVLNSSPGTDFQATSIVLLLVTETVLSHNKARSQSPVQQSHLSTAPCCPRGSLSFTNTKGRGLVNAFQTSHVCTVFYRGTADQNWFSVVVFNLGLPVYT